MGLLSAKGCGGPARAQSLCFDQIFQKDPKMELNKTVRAMERGDLPAMKLIIDGNDLFPGEMLDDMVASYLTIPQTPELWFVAADQTIKALAYCAPERMTEGTWNLYLIAVDPAHQGRGIGAALMRHVETVLAAQGQRVLLVETSALPGFERTRQFYLKNGYTLEARIRDFYTAGEDKIVFHKAL
jgi:GNAT superfamily N-acetyltransferase